MACSIWQLARDMEIALFNHRGLGNGWLLPAGPLREPRSRLDRVDAIAFNGTRRDRCRSAALSHADRHRQRVRVARPSCKSVVVSCRRAARAGWRLPPRPGSEHPSDSSRCCARRVSSSISPGRSLRLPDQSFGGLQRRLHAADREGRRKMRRQCVAGVRLAAVGVPLVTIDPALVDAVENISVEEEPWTLACLTCWSVRVQGSARYDRRTPGADLARRRARLPDPRWHPGDARGRGAQARRQRKLPRRRDSSPSSRRGWLRRACRASRWRTSAAGRWWCAWPSARGRAAPAAASWPPTATK